MESTLWYAWGKNRDIAGKASCCTVLETALLDGKPFRTRMDMAEVLRMDNRLAGPYRTLKGIRPARGLHGPFSSEDDVWGQISMGDRGCRSKIGRKTGWQEWAARLADIAEVRFPLLLRCLAEAAYEYDSPSVCSSSLETM